MSRTGKGKGRKKPRKDQYSLPAQRMRLPFDFSPDEITAFITALRKKAAELSQALGCLRRGDAGRDGAGCRTRGDSWRDATRGRRGEPRARGGERPRRRRWNNYGLSGSLPRQLLHLLPDHEVVRGSIEVEGVVLVVLLVHVAPRAQRI